jgi:hypothetical protein
MDLVQHFTFGTTLREDFLADALFAGAFYQIPDFEIVFIFEPFICHFLRDTIQRFYSNTENLVLWARSEKIGCAVNLCLGMMEYWNDGTLGLAE